MMISTPRPDVRAFRLLVIMSGLALACTLHASTVMAGTSESGLATDQIARGVVYLDGNNNQQRDANEQGLSGVMVSNGLEIVRTNDQGRYEIPVTDDTVLFVIKPRNYRTVLNELNIPQRHYIHMPQGSPDQDYIYAGIEPTGPLPDSVDFPLYASAEPDKFMFLALGDTQPYNMQQMDWLARDTFAEIIDNNAWGAAFGVTLGDLVGDDLSLFNPLNDIQAQAGVPWYNIFGNHDMNFMSVNDEHSDETYTRHYGPATYAFQHGPAHFIALDNVIWNGFNGMRDNGQPVNNNYRGGLRDDQLTFIENYLAQVPTDELVILMMHIPIEGEEVHQIPERRRLFEVLSSHPNTISLSGHTHFNEHWFFGSQAGYTAGTEHHHWNAGAASGSWFRGHSDERGIPFTTMRCGAPNGYTLVTIDGNTYSMRYKVSSAPADYQMEIIAPANTPASEAAGSEVVVNVFAGSSKSRVEYRLNEGPWQTMQRDIRPEPNYLALKALELTNPPVGRPLPDPRPSTHIWVSTLPSELTSGAHTIKVRHTDMFGQIDHATRVIHLQ